MPRDIKTFTNCAAPGVARSHKQLDGLPGLLISAWFQNKWLTGGAVLGFLIAVFFTPIGNPATWTVTLVVLVAALLQVKYWYYNERLLCIEEEECAIGTVVSFPSVSFDGDRKLDLMLAPFTQLDCLTALSQHIDTNRQMLEDNGNFNDPPFHNGVAPNVPPTPIPPNNASLPQLQRYMAELRSKNPEEPDIDSNMFSQVVIGVVDRLMSDPQKNFLNRFYRKQADHIPPGSSLNAAIPRDFDASVDWDQPNALSTASPDLNPYRDRFEILNPMFRFKARRDPEGNVSAHLVPFLHCEIDGNSLALLIDTIIMALIAFVTALIILTSLFGPIGAIGAFIAAIAVILLKNLIDNLFRNGGEAGEPDVDFDDPDAVDTTPIEDLAGDLVAVEGRWIMDTEHGNYFEIHPVRSYFLIARNPLGDEPIPVDSEEEREKLGADKFDPIQIDSDRARRICNFVREIDDPVPIVEKTAPEALSYGMKTHYGGGGITAL